VKRISWSLSDVGRKRDHNEDSLLVDDKLALYVVADGMGGHQGGDHASRMAVDVLKREVERGADFEATAQKLIAEDPSLAVTPLDTTVPGAPLGPNGTARDPSKETLPLTPGEDTLPLRSAPQSAAATVLRAAARVAGRAIFDAAQADPRLSGMGTTLTSLLFHKDRAHLAHVGDSRAFLFRDGRIEQITEDHSWIAEQVKAGVMTEAEAKESKFRHIITRSVGFEREVDVDLLGVPVLPGDCFIMCSDGMSNYIEAEEIGRILASTYYRKVPQLLVDLANDRGGDDNITVVLVYIANDNG
jgi:serine/threonine protein phosphatase PrpC